jgi:hypothetical protein
LTLRELAEESQESANKSRLIPLFSADAVDPADVYPLQNIIPEAEWKAIPISGFETAQSHQERAQLLAYRKSDWIHYHLRIFGQKENKNNKHLYVVQKNWRILTNPDAFVERCCFIFRRCLHSDKPCIPKQKKKNYTND